MAMLRWPEDIMLATGGVAHMLLLRLDLLSVAVVGVSLGLDHCHEQLPDALGRPHEAGRHARSSH